MSRTICVAFALLAACTVETSKIDQAASTPPCEGELSFMTPDIKTLQWIASGDHTMYVRELEQAYHKKFKKLNKTRQKALAGVIMALMSSANVDAVTTTKPVGIENMTDGKFNDIIGTKEYRGAIRVYPMKVTCDATTGLVKKLDYKEPYKSKGWTPKLPIGLRLIDSYSESEAHPTNFFAKQGGGVGQKFVSVEVMVQARISRPMSDINDVFVGVDGVPWIQNWVKLTATCDPGGSRVEAQFTKMPTSALWVENKLEQHHGQEGLGDFIVNHPNVLAPLHTKFDKTYPLDDDLCAGSWVCPDPEYSYEYDVCPTTTTSVTDASGGTVTPCFARLAETASPLGTAFKSVCMMDPDENGEVIDMPCRAGQQWLRGRCADPVSDCEDECPFDGELCWGFDDGLNYVCREAASGCMELELCDAPYQPEYENEHTSPPPLQLP